MRRTVGGKNPPEKNHNEKTQNNKHTKEIKVRASTIQIVLFYII